MKKVFLFDLDGVIIKTKFFTEKYEADFGFSKEVLYQFLKEILPNTQVGKTDLKEVLSERLKNFGWSKSIDEFLNYWFEYDSCTDAVLLEEIQLLRRDGHYCFLLTNQEKYRYQYLLEVLKIGDKFDQIFSSHMIGFSKNQGEYFIQVLKILKQKYTIDENDCIFFDDKENFIESAKKSGVESVLYTSIDSFLKYKNSIK